MKTNPTHHPEFDSVFQSFKNTRPRKATQCNTPTKKTPEEFFPKDSSQLPAFLKLIMEDTYERYGINKTPNCS